jgi:hypothetical protein
MDEKETGGGTVLLGQMPLAAGWVVIQLIARKSHYWPVTLLEVHVLVHVIWAIAIYGFWLNKSLDVRDPRHSRPRRAACAKAYGPRMRAGESEIKESL